jgi:hypothetical protein
MNQLDQLKSGKLKSSTTFKYSGELTCFPNELFDLAESLELLDLSGNKLSSLPKEFAKFKRLKIVFFSDNLFTEFPEVLSKCPQLEMIGFKANQIKTIPENAIPINCKWLILTNNRIEKLPDSIGKCLRLQKVMLAGNLLSSLPETMGNCKNIELLRISVNKLNSLPDWLFDLPKLSWLAFSENPFCKTEAKNDLKKIDWKEIKIEKQLGEGASGIISKAKLKENNVAVKIFKGDVTSDGLPSSEMLACANAGKHKNLVNVLGEIKNHENKKEGLALELIPEDFKNLGNPPSFKTCTRDTFEENTEFEIKNVLKILTGIATAMSHLHSSRIMHGDLYAHNILVNKKSETLLSDFGAATQYNIHYPFSTHLEKIDVRAFGCLGDDLLNLTSDKNENRELAVGLEKLKKSCFNPKTELRPNFKDIYNTLVVISSTK